jgi:IPT/TIG domain
MKKLFYLFMLLLNALALQAQKPNITNFTPTSGVVGTSVTITGANFNATAAQNVVYFGATKATVTAASTTSLTVTVPVGATFQPISVLNLSTVLTGFSSAPFRVTYLGGSIVAESLGEDRVDFTTGALALFIATGDLDGYRNG